MNGYGKYGQEEVYEIIDLSATNPRGPGLAIRPSFHNIHPLRKYLQSINNQKENEHQSSSLLGTAKVKEDCKGRSSGNQSRIRSIHGHHDPP